MIPMLGEITYAIGTLTFDVGAPWLAAQPRLRRRATRVVAIEVSEVIRRFGVACDRPFFGPFFADVFEPEAISVRACLQEAISRGTRKPPGMPSNRPLWYSSVSICQLGSSTS